MGNVIIAAAPLIFAGLGALLTELAGSLTIAIEGFMIFGAFFGFVFAGWTGNILLGTLAAALLSALLGFLLILFIQKSGSDPFIAGLALNLAAAGLVGNLSQLFFGTSGVLRNSALAAPPRYAFAFAAVFSAVILAVAIKRTTLGMRLRAAGASPAAAAERGIAARRYVVGAWTIAAFLAAIGGAALSFRVGVYAPGGTAGRGWIALAAVYLGFKNVWGLSAAALIFAAVEQLAFKAQEIAALPSTALLGLPQALALILYVLSARLKLAKKK
jgi:simple sugar transport system permease protein